MLGGDGFLDFTGEEEEEEGRGSVYSIPIEKKATAKKWYMRSGGEGRSLYCLSASTSLRSEKTLLTRITD